MSTVGRVLGWVYFVSAVVLGCFKAPLWTILIVALLGLGLDYDDPHFLRQRIWQPWTDGQYWLLAKLNVALYSGQIIIVGACYGLGRLAAFLW